MSTRLFKIKDAAFRMAMRVLMPDLARQMAQEGLLGLDATGGHGVEDAHYMRVEDRGSPVTIFAFSGLDVLFAGLARFEFQNVLKRLGVDANLVFLRDVHRTGFGARPDGSAGGLDFYAAAIGETMARLGSTHHIAVGSSIGGSAALYFGTRCGMQQIVVFGAAFTTSAFAEPAVMARTFLDLRQLLREPRAYVELIVVTLCALWGRRQLVKRFGAGRIPRPLDLYREREARPPLTLFYGATAWPDARQAQMLGDLPEATVVPLPTGRHNTPAFLKQHGLLAESLRTAIEAHLPAEPGAAEARAAHAAA